MRKKALVIAAGLMMILGSCTKKADSRSVTPSSSYMSPSAELESCVWYDITLGNADTVKFTYDSVAFSGPSVGHYPVFTQEYTHISDSVVQVESWEGGFGVLLLTEREYGTDTIRLSGLYPGYYDVTFTLVRHL
jgi:hypothetical protein